MILTGDVRPEETLYYIGGQILSHLQDALRSGGVALGELAHDVCESCDISSAQFFHGMDWLFLLGALDIRDGEVVLCS